METFSELKRKFDSLPRVGTFHFLDFVQIGANRQLGFAYSFENDMWCLSELRLGEPLRVIDRIRIGPRQEKLYEAILDFAEGNVGDEEKSVVPPPDKKNYFVCREVRIREREFLGFGGSEETGCYAMFHRTSGRTHVIPIELEYDGDELVAALERFYERAYPIVEALVHAYNAEVERERQPWMRVFSGGLPGLGKRR